MNKNPFPDDLPADLQAYLESVPTTTPEMIERVAAAHRNIENDPGFQADYLKSLFVEKMSAALEERCETKATLADRLGKTRQYIQKLFSENKRVNFTIETMCSVAHVLGRRIHFHICREHEQPVIFTRTVKPIAVRAHVWERRSATIHPTSGANHFIVSTNLTTVSASLRKEAQVEYAAAA